MQVLQVMLDSFFLALLPWMFILFAPAFSEEGDPWLILHRIKWAFIVGTFVLQIVLSISQVALSKKSKWMRYISPAIFFGYSVFFAIIFSARMLLDDYDLSLLGYSIVIAYFMALIGNVYTVALIIMGRFIRWICGIVRDRRNRE